MNWESTYFILSRKIWKGKIWDCTKWIESLPFKLVSCLIFPALKGQSSNRRIFEMIEGIFWGKVNNCTILLHWPTGTAFALRQTFFRRAPTQKCFPEKDQKLKHGVGWMKGRTEVRPRQATSFQSHFKVTLMGKIPNLKFSRLSSFFHTFSGGRPFLKLFPVPK